MTSVNSILKCIGADGGSVSMLHDLFDFSRSRVPVDPDSTKTASVSLLRLLRDLKGQHVHLNVIRVGFDGVPDQDDAAEKLDWAVLRVRKIDRQVNLGLIPILVALQ